MDVEVNRQMVEEYVRHPKREIADPYMNLLVLLQNDPNDVGIYSIQLDFYYNSKMKQFRNRVQEEADRAKFMSLYLAVNNDKRICPTGCDIELRFNNTE